MELANQAAEFEPVATEPVREGPLAALLEWQAGSIAPIFKRVAQWMGTPEKIVDRVSGHSTRVFCGIGLI